MESAIHDERRRKRLPGRARRHVRPGRDAGALARAVRRLGLRVGARRQPHLQRVRRIFGAPYWSLSKWAKHKVKNAVNFIGAFEKALATEAKQHRADGVICGHIHTPRCTTTSGCATSIAATGSKAAPRSAKRHDGQFEIITWIRERSETPSVARAEGGVKILVATDAWQPQVNGVVRHSGIWPERSRARRQNGIRHSGGVPHRAAAELSGDPPCAAAAGRDGAAARAIKPDAIHIATEGPIGIGDAAVCLRRGLPFTTSFHTRFPDYLAERLPVPRQWSEALVWRWLRRFPRAAAPRSWRPRRRLAAELATRGFKNVRLWPRGVDAGCSARAKPISAAAPDLSDGRPAGGREEPGGVSGARSAGHQGGGG